MMGGETERDTQDIYRLRDIGISLLNNNPWGFGCLLMVWPAPGAGLKLERVIKWISHVFGTKAKARTKAKVKIKVKVKGL